MLKAIRKTYLTREATAAGLTPSTAAAQALRGTRRNDMELIIDNEFRNLIPPLTDEEFKQLEENILRDGG